MINNFKADIFLFLLVKFSFVLFAVFSAENPKDKQKF